jgi:hypothetical protein
MAVLPIDQPPVTIQPAQEHTDSAHARGQIYLDGKPVTIDELKARLAAPNTPDGHTTAGQNKQ